MHEYKVGLEPSGGSCESLSASTCEGANTDYPAAWRVFVGKESSALSLGLGKYFSKEFRTTLLRTLQCGNSSLPPGRRGDGRLLVVYPTACSYRRSPVREFGATMVIYV
ncbi:hypothetical protein PHLCEN_2v11349 [Hermanssonia centrifuga]|uniref:Uncharacterized protein n=1 Tax=Hermanssonia centrifuga TaxID=98765 RepID=A0A2R6NKD4_9APHY|nr:hypothetical protein PHLCEN_2v11349 [Hermanssonia centrifuga]